MKIQCPYYELSLDDYSSPSFCSFAKPFYGRLSDIQSLIDALASDNQKGIHDELIAAFAAFQKGDLMYHLSNCKKANCSKGVA